MSSSNSSRTRRSLPSWMSSRENKPKSRQRSSPVPGSDDEINEAEAPKEIKGHGTVQAGSTHPHTESRSRKDVGVSSSAHPDFSKLLEGVGFVLSGFVNPERGVLRSKALGMGAEYQQDWNSGCTLLICAFPNTPKFRQVEADNGTIVSKDWILECYTQKKLVDIEPFLLHAGKPWRKSRSSHESGQDGEATPPSKLETKDHVGKQLHPKQAISSSSKNGASNLSEAHFSSLKIKSWVTEDLNNTISWLESQEEKPKSNEIKNVAAEGILTCLQDTIDALDQKQDIRQITEQWNFIPRAVEELAKLDKAANGSSRIPKEELHRQAVACKQIYEAELKNSEDSFARKRKEKTDECSSKKTNHIPSDATGYDTDETIEMTEEEVDLAYNNIASKRASQC